MNRNKEILCFKVEIAAGHKELLKVREDDEPETLASDFCKKFKLDPKFQQGLSNLIEYQIDSLLESQLTCNSYPRQPLSQNPIPEEPGSPLLSLDNSKLDLYYDLFEELSDPEQKKLSYETGSFLGLSKAMQRILEPISEELKESGESISFSEFTRAMDLLVKSLNARDRILLLNDHMDKGRSSRKTELKKEIGKLRTLKDSRHSGEPFTKVINLKGFYQGNR